MEKFNFRTAVAVVIANMVGTGVFTSLGFQLNVIQSGFAIMMLWVLGGIAAVCGAMSYAELGAALPRSGGEYNFLSRIYHPAAGFVSACTSASIGFAAPVAAAALIFGTYATAMLPGGAPGWVVKALALGLVIGLTTIHTTSHKNSGGTQLVFTALKVAVIIVFCIAALSFSGEPQPVKFLPQPGDSKLIFSSAFAVSLIYVSYAYTGWNSATYLSSELEDPQRSLPRILFTGTLVVMVLYVSLNFVFLRVTPIADMVGQVEIGFIAAQSAFGDTTGRIVGGSLALLMVSTVSAMVIAGPRVLQVVGEDFHVFRLLARKNRHDIPANAIWFQTAVTVLFILIANVETIILFSGLLLALNTFTAVLGLFVLRWRQPDLERPYRVPLYPIVPLIYLALTGATIVFVLISRPVEALIAAGFVAGSILIYFLVGREQARE
ncbi:MAG: amino acid permease [Hyphomonadaceae bacterium]